MIFTPKGKDWWMADLSMPRIDFSKVAAIAAPPKHPLLAYKMTIAEITYRLPDFPSLVQTYLWQEFDKAPLFPALTAFLDFWQQNLEGKLHRVEVTTKDLVDGPQIGAGNILTM